MASPAGDSHLFAGVHFLLIGFDCVSMSQYRSKLVQSGGTDAMQFGGGWTHIVVRGLVNVDPVCAVARAQGNKVVSEMWVDDRLDQGVLADADKVIYWPARDLKGIPGSGSLQICLTGYQMKDRKDIMLTACHLYPHIS